MNRAHVTLDDGREAEVLVREFTVSSNVGCEPEVTINGFLTRLDRHVEHYNCKCDLTQTRLTIRKVIHNDPATVIYWSDNTRTVVKCQPGDKFDPELGFLLALCKKVCGNTGNYNELLRKYVPGCQTEPSIEQMRKELHNFCKLRGCKDCPMGRDGFECGRGKMFTVPAGKPGHMTDKSIVKHYRAMKEEKEG